MTETYTQLYLKVRELEQQLRDVSQTDNRVADAARKLLDALWPLLGHDYERDPPAIDDLRKAAKDLQELL